VTQARIVLWEALVLAAACSFALAATLARLTYEAGSNALTVVTVRTLFTAAVLMALLRATRGPFMPPPAERRDTVVMGLLLIAQSYGLYGSYQYMPVGLALIVFYTFPIITLLANAALHRRRLGAVEMLAPALAFAGLALALAPGGGDWHPAGPLHAAVAAVTFSAILIFSARRFRSPDSRPRTLLMFAVASPAFLVAGAGLHAFALPVTAPGWIAFAIVPVLYCAGITLTWAAVPRIGPVRLATLLNIEPIAAMSFRANRGNARSFARKRSSASPCGSHSAG
jgi:drug/metabolite transporter (DMT)-like permease